MKSKLLIITIIILITVACQEVKREVINNGDRVAVAYKEKEAKLQTLFESKAVKWENFQLFFRVFKQEEILEVWAKNTTTEYFTLMKTYPFCTNSGTLGPKRKEGDRQIIEGFYTINRFNPKSSFYLSLGLNYPNKSDLILSDKDQPGSDIFMHGACVSVGCISITDDKIKEIYLLANEAKKQGQTNIEVHCFPFKLDNNSIERVIKNQPEFAKNKDFWQNLKVGYDFFNQKKQSFDIDVNDAGKYIY